MDRPIKSKGYYDMKFIDWNNEFENIACGDYNWDSLDTDQECPIHGMDIATFNEIINQEIEQQDEQQDYIQNNEGLTDEQIKQIKHMKMGKSSKECTICVSTFDRGDVILRLPQCQHIFHKDCVLSWLKQNTKCPNCRLDLKQYLKQ